MDNFNYHRSGFSKGAANIDNNDNNELTSLETAIKHPKANASSFPLNQMADTLFWTTTEKQLA